MDITVDEDFSVGFISNNNNFNTSNTLTGCCICAEDHETHKCATFYNFQHIEDTKVLPRALLTLPDILRVELLVDGSKTVIAEEFVPKGTQFGPYQAEKFYSSMNPFNNFPIKVFGDSENILPDCYLDSRNEEKCNWMCYIPAANNIEEQNLICYQIKHEIFYSVIHDIVPGDHLKVWYSTYYAAKIGSKVHEPIVTKEPEPDDHEKIQQVAERLPARKFGAPDRQNWYCKMCGLNETNVVKFARHLQKHYKKMMKNLFVCNICNAGFSTEKSLKDHRKYIHTVLTEHKPQEVENFNTNKTETSKTDLMEPLPIDHLMSVNISESDQLLMLDQLSIPNSGIYNDLSVAETLRAILLDDNTKASKTAQEKSIADFSLEFVESNDTIPKLQAPYYCDICNKLFHNLPNLFRHLKKHAGEHTCVHCLSVFTRRENYLRHPCFTTSSTKRFNCSLCTKWYYQKKYLKRHMRRHLENYTCDKCGNHYKSKTEQLKHNCSAVPNAEKQLFTCNLCNRNFSLEIYLQKHFQRVHTIQESRNIIRQSLICEICAKSYNTANALRTHKAQHFEPKYECNICDKKFYRLDIYNNHLLSHGTKNEVCDICNKKFKYKRTLYEHKLLHDNMKFSCDDCGKSYARKSSLREHQRRNHLDNPINCPECGKTFKNNFLLAEHNRLIHKPSIHVCHICDKSFTLTSLLTRHMKIHSVNEYSCQYCSKTFKYSQALRKHLRAKHLEFKNQWNKPGSQNKNIKGDSVQNETEILQCIPETEKETKVLLRIPETNRNLGKNVCILENGTMETSMKTREVDTNSTIVPNLSSNTESVNNPKFVQSTEVLLQIPETVQNSTDPNLLLSNPESVVNQPKSVENSDVLLHVPETATNLFLMPNEEPLNLITNNKSVDNTEILLQISETEQNLQQDDSPDLFVMPNVKPLPLPNNHKSVENTEVLLQIPETEQNLEQDDPPDLFVMPNAEPVDLIHNPKSVENTEVLLQIPETEQDDSPELFVMPNAEPIPTVSTSRTVANEVFSSADTDQQITLGKNAYILEDGTIVQPQEQGDLMIYILNQQLNN